MSIYETAADEDPDYPTDKWGRPDGRDHHYRIPYSDEVAIFRTVVDLTLTEFEEALDSLGETWTEEVQPAIRWAKDEAMAEFDDSAYYSNGPDE